MYKFTNPRGNLVCNCSCPSHTQQNALVVPPQHFALKGLTMQIWNNPKQVFYIGNSPYRLTHKSMKEWHNMNHFPIFNLIFLVFSKEWKRISDTNPGKEEAMLEFVRLLDAVCPAFRDHMNRKRHLELPRQRIFIDKDVARLVFVILTSIRIIYKYCHVSHPLLLISVLSLMNTVYSKSTDEAIARLHSMSNGPESVSKEDLLKFEQQK